MQKHLSVSISAPYHTLNQLKEDTRNIWLVCHGQGQLAEYFIKKFESLDPDENFIIAPQGLSKYYLNGFSGRVGASWMTREDRETEIENQQQWIKAVWEAEVKEIAGRQVIFFGFSQGVATISRFAAYSKLPFHQMILWAGSFAHDLPKNAYNHLRGGERIHYYTSREDPFFEDSMIAEQKSRVRDATGLEPQLTFYQGGHRVVAELLPGLVNH